MPPSSPNLAGPRGIDFCLEGNPEKSRINAYVIWLGPMTTAEPINVGQCSNLVFVQYSHDEIDSPPFYSSFGKIKQLNNAKIKRCVFLKGLQVNNILPKTRRS